VNEVEEAKEVDKDETGVVQPVKEILVERVKAVKAVGA
jgi:hypothetical protein